MRLTRGRVTTSPSGSVAARAHGREARSYGWKIVGTLAITETVSWGVLYYAFAVIQVPMRAELGISAATTAGAFSVAVLVTGLSAVPVGRWLDRHGARGLMTAGSLAAVGLVIAWSKIETAVELYLVLAGIGLASSAVLYEPAFALLVLWFRVDRDRALLTVTVVAGLASTVFLPLTDALVGRLGWRDALVVLAIGLAVATVVPHAVVLRRAPSVADRPSGDPLAASGAAPDQFSPAGDPAPRPSTWDAVRTAARDPALVWLTTGFALSSFAVVVVAVHLVPLLVERGWSPTFAATAAGSLGLLSVAGRIALTGAARRRSVATVTAAAFALQAAGVWALLVAGSTAVGVVAFVLLFGLGFGVGTIARPSMIADAVGLASYATTSAICGVALTAGKTLGPFLAGLVRTGTGSYTAVLVLVGVVCAAAAVSVARSGGALAAHGPAL